ncbi:MAG: hypothetical protein Greene071421_169 [Parcubacteria group bacterium Greene0714_21]|nr:MAG: hypothetical protein Greene071421_169 [Parcubacteria group bacterium Greene0714_21]
MFEFFQTLFLFQKESALEMQGQSVEALPGDLVPIQRAQITLEGLPS